MVREIPTDRGIGFRPRTGSTGNVHRGVLVGFVVLLLIAGPATAGPVAPDGPEAADDRGGVTIDSRDGLLYLPATDDATVSGTATWAPGTELTVVLRSDGGSPPFVRRAVVGVDEYGNWEVTFDLSRFSNGRQFTVTVRAHGRVEATVDGKLGPSASVTFEDQVAGESGTVVTVRSVYLEVGGFVVIREAESRDVVGLTDYLPPGNYTNVSIRLGEPVSGTTELLATPRVDSDGNHQFGFLTELVDEPFLENGTPVRSRAEVQGPTPTPDSTPTPSPSPTSTPTDTPRSQETPTPYVESGTSTRPAETTPGFGPLLAVAALLSVAVPVARLRDRNFG